MGCVKVRCGYKISNRLPNSYDDGTLWISHSVVRFFNFRKEEVDGQLRQLKAEVDKLFKQVSESYRRKIGDLDRANEEIQRQISEIEQVTM